MRFPKLGIKLDIPVVAFWVPYMIAVVVGYGALIARFAG